MSSISSSDGLRAEQADAARRVRRVVGHDRLAGESLDDRCARASAPRPAPPAGRDAPPLRPRIAIFVPSLSRSARRCRSASAGRPEAPSMIGMVFGGRAGATCCHGSASASATWMSFGMVRCATPRRAYAVRMALSTTLGQLRRVVDHLVVLGDVGVQLVEVDLLLVAGAEHGCHLHAGDGEDRHVIELGVVQAVEQVDAARPGGGQADADLCRSLSRAPSP